MDFSIYSLRVDRTMFSVETFSDIEDRGEESFPKDFEREILSVDVFHKENINKRFVAFDFDFRQRYPYSLDVINVKSRKNLKKKKNPRNIYELELKDQLFVLVDISLQRMYVSNIKKKRYFLDFLKTKIKKDFTAQPIINEEDFLKKIKIVKEICLTVDPGDLFSGLDTLSRLLKEDINSFQADQILLDIKYDKGISVHVIREKLERMIGNKASFRRLTVIGQEDGRFESVFNVDGVITRFQIPYNGEEKSKTKDSKRVFELLIDQIEENEKETK